MAGETYGASSPSSDTYEVFLSFRGEIRKTFIDHLYHALRRVSIRTFRDREALEHGEEIGELLKAIKRSKIIIPVFSEGYASSKWCLKEITKIMECHETDGQIVWPIFYKIDPSHVRNQTGSFEKAFLEHEQNHPKETVDSWRKALKKAGDLKGWDSENTEYSYEAELINLVVEKALNELNKTIPLSIVKYPVGIDSHVDQVLKLLEVQSKDVKFVGIHGMGGIGKTTIAKVVFKRMFLNFQGHSFLQNVRERASQNNGLVELQNQLVSDILKGTNIRISVDDIGIGLIKERFRYMKVLIILDDVDHRKQLEALAGGCNWFGPESRIIITTRNMQILSTDYVEKDKIYQPKELDDNQSLELFSSHAFGMAQPPEDFRELSEKFARRTGGLPLALEVLGSSLRDKRGLAIWESALEKLNKFPYLGVQKVLEISYKGLDYNEREIFLDIACFLIGMDKETISGILEDYSPGIGIEVLVLKSLVKIDHEDKIRMHDLLRDMGREIVRKKNNKNPEKRRRLWDHVEAMKALKNGKNVSEVEGLRLDFSGYEGKARHVKTKAFATMPELRILQVDYADLDGDLNQLPEGLKLLSLKGLHVNCVPTISHLEALSVFDLSQSMITEDWNGWQHIQSIQTLKVLDLSGCELLTRTPDFSNCTSLERLTLDDCSGLIECHESIGNLKKLVYLSMRNCTKFEGYPTDFGRLSSLKVLELARNTFRSLGASFNTLSGLQHLTLNDCHQLLSLPDLPSSLVVLNLYRCVSLESFPDLSNLKNIRELFFTDCHKITKIENIDSLTQLRELYLFKCPKLQSVSEFPSSLKKLFVRECESLQRLPYLSHLKNVRELYIILCQSLTEIPDVSGLSQLEFFYLMNCGKVLSLQNLPSSLNLLGVQGCVSLVKIDLSNLKNLEKLDIFELYHLAEIRGLESLESLIEFRMANCYTYNGTFQKCIVQGMLSGRSDCSKGKIRDRYQIPDDDENINGATLYFVYELSEDSEPAASSPDNWKRFFFKVVIRRNDRNIIFFHDLIYKDTMPKSNGDHFYSCYFQGLTWFGLPLKKGDVIKLIGYTFQPEQEEIEFKMLDFVMEYEAIEGGEQLVERFLQHINSACVETEGLGNAEKEDDAGPSTRVRRIQAEEMQAEMLAIQDKRPGKS